MASFSLEGVMPGELVDESGGNDSNNLIAALDGLDQLEDLAFVNDGAERAVDKAHAAETHLS